MRLNTTVREVMIRRIKAVPITATIKDVADIMKRNKIGSVIVLDKNKKVVGIVTKSDIVFKYVLAGKKRLKDVMSSKLIKISPNKMIEEAARKMVKYDVEQLLVYDKGKFVGIISASDILRVEPALFEILIENIRTKGPEYKSEESTFGICESCGNYSDDLKEVNGVWLCPECREEQE
ncbi:MAG: CBS domain-containing protein [Candidatus Aenigmarchaeota archaeon]|nr:CBS domain-containing protein [Candidatus Aenigmarchaeota archaeon]